jgi:hypothetical protein
LTAAAAAAAAPVVLCPTLLLLLPIRLEGLQLVVTYFVIATAYALSS